MALRRCLKNPLEALMAYRKSTEVRTAEEYTAALARIGELMRGETELRALAAAVERYEMDNFPVAAPTAIGAIRFRIEQMGIGSRDLEHIFGSRGKMSEVLSGKRGLSLAMIRALHRELGIPASILIGAAMPDPNSN